MTNAFNRSSVCGETAQRLQALLQFGVGGEARCSGFVALEREREVHVAAVFLSRCNVGIEEQGAVKELHGLFKTAHAGFNHRQVVVWLRNFGIFGNERTKGFGGFLRAAEPFERDGSAEAKLGAAGIFFQAKVGKFKRLCRVSGLEKLIKASYRLLGLISYLTAGEPEVRAWTIKKGTKAPQAAGKIHSDFERGFIRAEVVAYDDLIACGNMTAAKEKGLVRSEGKEYVVKDGDVVLFRFNV